MRPRGAIRHAAAGRLAIAVVIAVACRSDVGGHAEAGSLAVRHAVVVVAPGTGSQASAFLELENRSPAPVTLVGARSPAAERVQVHGMSGGRMAPVAQLTVPPHAPLRLGPGRYHLMLDSLVHPLARGDTVPLELRFAVGPPLSVRAPVLRYTEAVDAVQR
jgi:hypothetical protein